MNQIAPMLQGMGIDTVTVEPYISTDEYGNVTYSAGVDYKCRVLGRTRSVLDQDGQEQLSAATIIFFGDYGLTTLDRYTLPPRFGANIDDPSDLPSRQPRALNIDRETDENAAHHTTVYFSISRLRGY
jgi:hypothetical protein